MNICKIIALLILSFNSGVPAFSQEIKTYNGRFGRGSATYQYFENEDQERVFHGAFIYEFNDKKITGEFDNNKPDGRWSYYKKNLVLSSIQFSKGSKEGKWTFKIQEDEMYKAIRSYETLSLIFKDDKLHGSFEYFRKSIDGRTDKMTGQYQLKGYFKFGYMDSTWIESDSRDSDYEPLIEKYHKGIKYYSFRKQQSTGDIEKFNDSLFVFELMKYPYGENFFRKRDSIFQLTRAAKNENFRYVNMSFEKSILVGSLEKLFNKLGLGYEAGQPYENEYQSSYELEKIRPYLKMAFPAIKIEFVKTVSNDRNDQHFVEQIPPRHFGIRIVNVKDELNKNIKVAIDIVTDVNGKVISATYQPRGSTTSNPQVIANAQRRASEIKDIGTGEGPLKGTIIFNY